MSSKRQAFVWAFYGKTGSGKSTTQIEICKEWKLANPGERVIGYDPHDVFKDEKLLTNYIRETDDNWAEILLTRLCNKCGRIKHPEKEECLKCGHKEDRFKFYNSFVALDDYRNLLKADSLPQEVLSLFGMKRKIRLDIMISMHNPMLLLERISYFVQMHFIFATESSLGDFSKKIAQYVPCQRAANMINAYVMDMGGVESDAYRNMYPNFPHVIVTNSSNKLITQNMDIKIINRLKDEGKF